MEVETFDRESERRQKERKFSDHSLSLLFFCHKQLMQSLHVVSLHLSSWIERGTNKLKRGA